MTTKQKCEKFSRILETVVSKLREDIGTKVWEKEEPTMQVLVSHAHIFLKKAMDISSTELPSTAKIKIKHKELKTEEEKEFNILNNWPDILS